MAPVVESPPEVDRLPLGFRVAAAGATVVLAIGLVVLALRPLERPADTIPALVAAATLCAGLLARRWAPALAWLALIVASVVAASIPIAVSSGADPSAIGLGTWLVVAGRSSAAAVITVAITALYAARPDRRATGRVAALATFLVVWLAAACVLIAVLVLAGARYDPAFTWVDVATWPTTVFIQFVLLLTAFGVTADLRAAADRAERRLATSAPATLAGPPKTTDRLRATIRELLPGQAASEAAAVERERVRLASELHATVVPALRQAIADVEAGGSVEALAARLRTVDAELERLMADRWPAVLEAFGLVEALEDLAELTEADAGVGVAIGIDGAVGRPPPAIERAAWRIAQLAIDNAVRHAAASQITIGLAVAPAGVRLSIADDGRGFNRADPGPRSGRGLTDLRRRAAAVGGSVTIESSGDGGTVVRFDWPSPGSPTASPVTSTR
jgi:signal transduction histidine kinase